LRGVFIFGEKEEKDLTQRKRRGDAEVAEKRRKSGFLASLGMTILCRAQRFAEGKEESAGERED
jgi:hypothetical protein